MYSEISSTDLKTKPLKGNTASIKAKCKAIKSYGVLYCELSKVRLGKISVQCKYNPVLVNFNQT
jgi:hypothetical protein